LELFPTHLDIRGLVVAIACNPSRTCSPLLHRWEAQAITNRHRAHHISIITSFANLWASSQDPSYYPHHLFFVGFLLPLRLLSSFSTPLTFLPTFDSSLVLPAAQLRHAASPLTHHRHSCPPLLLGHTTARQRFLSRHRIILIIFSALFFRRLLPRLLIDRQVTFANSLAVSPHPLILQGLSLSTSLSPWLPSTTNTNMTDIWKMA
jgi:hypothetical protein